MPSEKDKPYQSTMASLFQALHRGGETGIAVAVADAVTYPPYGYRYLMQDATYQHSPHVSTMRRLLCPSTAYQGIGAYCLGSFPTFIFQNMIYYGLAANLDSNSHSVNFTCAATSGAVAAVAATPAGNLIRAQQRLNLSVKDAYQFLYSQGAKRLWRGIIPISARDSIYSASAYSIVGMIETHLHLEMGLSKSTTLSFAASFLSGFLCTLLSQPFDVLATKLHDHDGKSVSIKAIASEAVSKEGLRVLFQGGLFRITAIGLSTFAVSTVKRMMDHRFEEEPRQGFRK